MGQLTVRFVGAFLLHIDGSDFGRVYLRSNSAGTKTPHVPKITFPMAHARSTPSSLGPFEVDDELITALNGDRLVRRKLPPMGFEFNLGGSTTVFKRQSINPETPPSGDTELPIDYLPSLSSGGATALRPVNELAALSAGIFELGNRGIFTSSRVVKDGNTNILWEFRDDQGNPATKPIQQFITDIFCWTVDFNEQVLVNTISPAKTFLNLTDPGSSTLEILISNLEEQPMQTAADKLDEFAQLGDYAVNLGKTRFPVNPKFRASNVNPQFETRGLNLEFRTGGGSVSCPGARWP